MFMKKFAIVLMFVFALVLGAGAQKKMKPWTEWSEKEALKILNESAWGQTQTDTNTAEMFYSPTSSSGGSNRPFDNAPGSNSNEPHAQGALNQATNGNYRIRLLTSRPN